MSQSDAWNGDSPGWHSIRPWTPHLALSVREITSVSATFMLSSSLDDPDDPSLSSLGLSASDDEDDGVSDQCHNRTSNGEGSSDRNKRRAVISEALAKGLSVDVNGSPWHKVLLRINDQADEAVIIIYGLMPGRQYDIDLGLVQGGQNSLIREQVTTEESERGADVDLDREASKHDGSISSDSTSSSFTSVNASEIPTALQSQTNGINSAQFNVEDRVRQLQQSLSSLNTERDTLTTSLKNTRRESQKADAALRSEIDTLKRSFEKNASAEHRAKQKVLALQEAVKRAQTATKEIEELLRDVEASLPGARNQQEEIEADYVEVKAEADRVREEREKVQVQGRKRLDSMKNDLTGYGNRLEKLNGKREKLDTSTVPDLEEQLRELEKEIEKVESDEYQFTLPEGLDPSPDEGDPFGEFSPDGGSSTFGGGSQSRKRTHHPGPIGRPTLSTIPIHRPVNTSLTSPSQHQAAARTSYRSPVQQSSFIHSHQQSLPINLRSPGHTPATGRLSYSSNDITSAAPLSPSSSTLSSLAPPFEPSSAAVQAVRESLSSSQRYSFPPIQRPGPLLATNTLPVGGSGSSIRYSGGHTLSGTGNPGERYSHN